MYLGTSICFRGQANEAVAESKANRLEPHIRQIGSRKRVYVCPLVVVVEEELLLLELHLLEECPLLRPLRFFPMFYCNRFDTKWQLSNNVPPMYISALYGPTALQVYIYACCCYLSCYYVPHIIYV